MTGYVSSCRPVFESRAGCGCALRMQLAAPVRPYRATITLTRSRDRALSTSRPQCARSVVARQSFVALAHHAFPRESNRTLRAQPGAPGSSTRRGQRSSRRSLPHVRRSAVQARRARLPELQDYGWSGRHLSRLSRPVGMYAWRRRTGHNKARFLQPHPRSGDRYFGCDVSLAVP